MTRALASSTAVASMALAVVSLLIATTLACSPAGSPDVDGVSAEARVPPIAEPNNGGERPGPATDDATTASGTSIVRGTAPPATGEFSSVVVLRPTSTIDEGAAARAAAEPTTRGTPTDATEVMDQYGMAFFPAVMLVRRGDPVEFRNSEDVIHNVNAAPVGSTATEFNVGTIPGGSYHHVFTSTGAFAIRCNVHATMIAYVFVTDSPFAAVADRDGTFAIEGVAYGSYLLEIWNANGREYPAVRLEVDGPTAEVSSRDVDSRF